MARRRLPILLSLLALFAFVPGVTFAAGFFGPILPQSGSCHCDPLPLDWGCVLQVIQNLIQFAVSLGVILMVLWIAYAGFSLMVSGGSAEARSQGKTRIMNAIVGILVILSAWLIVDFVMKVLYEPNTAFSGGVFGPWNSILADNGGNYCIQETTPTAISVGSVISNITTVAPGTSAVLSAAGTGACNASVVQQGAAAGGYTLTNQQANQLACIAQPESGCGTKNAANGNQNYSWNRATSNGKASTAAGPYQVTIASHSACYQNPACTAAAGGQTLNCKQAFDSRGFVINQTLANECAQMAGNTACSASAAACAMSKGETFASMYATDNSVQKCASGS